MEHPYLWVAIKLRVAIALGIIYLMTVKPALLGSLLAIGIASILGLVAALPILIGGRAQKELSHVIFIQTDPSSPVWERGGVRGHWKATSKWVLAPDQRQSRSATGPPEKRSL